MSGETPAAHLARLKVTYQGWRIVRDSGGFTAQRRDGGGSIYARTLAELEARLIDAG